MPVKVYESLFRLMVPELCPRCRGGTRTGFCPGCRRDFIRNERACPICGLSAEPYFGERCTAHTSIWLTESVWAPYVYCDPIGRYLRAFKFNGERRLGRAFGQLLATAAAKRDPLVDALVAVPLHSSRLLERGFNQADELAGSVSHELGLPVLRAGIVRRRATPTQTGLGARKRHRNLREAFAVRRRLTNCRIAIVDDVITTGATVNALAEALLAAGAAHVEAWAVARTPRRAGRGVSNAR